MAFKILASILAIMLVLAYLGAVVIKLRLPALTVVVIIGVVLMLVDLWQSLRSKSD